MQLLSESASSRPGVKCVIGNQRKPITNACGTQCVWKRIALVEGEGRQVPGADSHRKRTGVLVVPFRV